ncbi:DUF4405 domain-containing protein [Fibrobacterota bacterium]
MGSNNSSFKFRRFISFTLFFSFLCLCLSGFALYIKPEGDIAHWIRWSFLGISKSGWEGFHALFSLFFLLFAIIHLCFNWKVLINYLKDKITRGLTLKKELFASIIIIILLLICTVMQWQPFWKIAEWRQGFKKNKNLVTVEEPESGFSKKKIAYIAEFINTSAEELVQKLNKLEIRVNNTNERLIDIAKANKTSPEKIYMNIIETRK